MHGVFGVYQTITLPLIASSVYYSQVFLQLLPVFIYFSSQRFLTKLKCWKPQYFKLRFYMPKLYLTATQIYFLEGANFAQVQGWKTYWDLKQLCGTFHFVLILAVVFHLTLGYMFPPFHFFSRRRAGGSSGDGANSARANSSAISSDFAEIKNNY